MTDKEGSETEAPLLYGTAEHAAIEALAESIYCHERWVQSSPEDLAVVVVGGLRKRGFVVAREPRCECGWTGYGNHQHDSRMGKAEEAARGI